MVRFIPKRFRIYLGINLHNSGVVEKLVCTSNYIPFGVLYRAIIYHLGDRPQPDHVATHCGTMCFLKQWSDESADASILWVFFFLIAPISLTTYNEIHAYCSYLYKFYRNATPFKSFRFLTYLNNFKQGCIFIIQEINIKAKYIWIRIQNHCNFYFF